MSWQAAHADDKGVSAVLGAVLMFGLLVVTLVTIQVRFVPVWQEDREAAGMGELADQVAALKADLDRQVGNVTSTGLTLPLTLGQEAGFSFFGGTGGSMGTIGFEPAAPGTGVVLRSPQLRIQQQGGQGLHGLSEEWNSSSAPVQDILRVEHLRLRVDMDPGDYEDGDSATLTVTDKNGDFAGKVVATFTDVSSEEALEVKTYNAANEELSFDVEAFFHRVTLDYFYWNLLDASLLFRDVLAAAEPPFSFAVARDGLVIDYAVAYTSQAIAGGLVGGGQVVPAYNATMPSGRLTIQANNGGFVDQAYIVEHGALILEQDDGAAMQVEPQMSATAAGGFAFIDWAIPALQGPASLLGGARSATVSIEPVGARVDMTAVAARFNITIPTAYPQLWRTFLEGRLQAGGMTGAGSSPNYVLATTGDTVILEVLGPQAAVGSAAEDVGIRFRQAAIQLDVRPSR